MQTPSSVKLSYFDARGRAQHVRYFLSARGIAFEDHRVPLDGNFSAWFAMRGDRSVAGPFHKLPVMHWDGRQIAETLVINAFLHRALGDEALLSDEQNLRHQMLTSSLYVDVMLPIGMLIWADIAFAGVDLEKFTHRTLDRLNGYLAALDRALEEWGWLDEARGRPVMLADCLLWEELDVTQRVFGPHVSFASLPTLARLHAESPVRKTAADWLGRHAAAPVTGRPQEPEAIAALQAAASRTAA